jgi:hypothetical protein
VHDIESTIVTMIWKTIEDASVEDTRFKFSKLHKTGGFYDGTRIRKPDVFDFVAILKELSNKPDMFEIDPVCASVNPGTAHVRLRKQSEFSKWRDCNPDDGNTGTLVRYKHDSQGVWLDDAGGNIGYGKEFADGSTSLCTWYVNAIIVQGRGCHAPVPDFFLL